MKERIKQIAVSIVHSVSKSVEEHRRLEKHIFGKNFEIGARILAENSYGFFEGMFLGHVHVASETELNKFKYRVFNMKSLTVELIPISNVSGYITK